MAISVETAPTFGNGEPLRPLKRAAKTVFDRGPLKRRRETKEFWTKVAAGSLHVEGPRDAYRNVAIVDSRTGEATYKGRDHTRARVLMREAASHPDAAQHTDTQGNETVVLLAYDLKPDGEIFSSRIVLRSKKRRLGKSKITVRAEEKSTEGTWKWTSKLKLSLDEVSGLIQKISPSAL